MKRLFVDCDDTLVLWLNKDGQPLEGQNPYGGGSDRWEANEPLIAAVLGALDDDPELRLIVWSGGGSQYAEHWAHRLLPGRWHMSATKDIRLPANEDTCVDDAHLKVAGRLLTPDQFIAEFQPTTEASVSAPQTLNESDSVQGWGAAG